MTQKRFLITLESKIQVKVYLSSAEYISSCICCSSFDINEPRSHFSSEQVVNVFAYDGTRENSFIFNACRGCLANGRVHTRVIQLIGKAHKLWPKEKELARR